MFQGLRTTIYCVEDVTAAKAWYTEILGIPPYFDEPFYVGFNVGGYELGLMPIEAPLSGPTTLSYWGVPDADDAYARLLERGAKPFWPVTHVGEGIRTGVVTDPFGCLVGVIYNPHFTVAPAD